MLSAVVLSLSIISFDNASAATVVNLGAVDNFAILGASTVTNTGSSVVTGDLGLSPGSSVTGFPPGVLNGTQHVSDTAASQAQTSLTAAYNNAAGQTSTATIPAELGGTTKTAGVYDSAPGSFSVTGTLTLDARGDPNAVFIFRTTSTLVTAGASTIALANGAQACNVFWQVGSSATLGANSVFRGNILALASITLTTGATMQGRALARTGAVTLDTNAVTRAVCATVATPTPVTSVTPTPVPTATPVPSISPSGTPRPTPTLTPTPVPGLPNTGIPPSVPPTLPWTMILLGSFGTISLAYITRKNQII